MSKKKPVYSYWTYRWRNINGKRRYVRVRKKEGKEQIRFAKRRNK